jgi:hypothetical protein
VDIFNPSGQTWLQAISLKPAEQILTAWSGNRETREQVARTKTVQRGVVFKHEEQVATGRSDTVKDTNSGFLVLTSDRLIWFERHGAISKQVTPAVYIDLLEIGGIVKGGSVAQWVSIADSHGEHLFHFGRMNDEDFTAQLRGPIVQAAYRLRQKMEAQRIEQVKTEERAKIAVKMVTCKYCEAKVAADKERCWRCGASDFKPLAEPSVLTPQTEASNQ